MTETENLFEIYDNVKQLSRLGNDMRFYDKFDIDTCLKFLNLIQYHKPLFKSESSANEYNTEVINLIDYRLSVNARLINIFEMQHDVEFPEEIYKVYSKFPNWKVRYYLVRNNHIPKYILEELVANEANEDYMVYGEAKAQLETRFNNK